LKTLAQRYVETGKRETWADLVQMFKSGINPPSGDGPVTPYKQSIWVYSCINALAKNVGQVPLILKTPQGAPVSASNITAKTLIKPNPYMTRFELLFATEAYMNVGGNCLWVPVFNPNGDIIEIWPFGRHQIECKLTDNGAFWKVKWSENQEEIFAYEEVIHFRYFNPYHAIYGMSPLEAARSSILQDWFANKYNEAFFQNNADPGVVLLSQGHLSPKQRTELRESWDERHGGFAKNRRTALLWGGVDVKELARASRRDMQFIEQKKMNREEIFAAFRVPPIEVMQVDAVSSRVESQKAQRTLFGEEVLWPELLYIAEKLNAFFTAWDMGVVADWDISEVSILQETLSEKIDRAVKLEKMGVPLNQIIKVLELPFEPVSWGDEYFVPSNMIPASKLLNSPTPSSPLNPKKPTEKPKKHLEGKEQLLLDVPRNFVLEKKLQRLFFLMRNSALRQDYNEDFWKRQVNRLLEKTECSPEAGDIIIRKIKREALVVGKEFPHSNGEQKVKILFNRMKKHAQELSSEICSYGKENFDIVEEVLEVVHE
jgi:HK97 family phage portal protein